MSRPSVQLSVDAEKSGKNIFSVTFFCQLLSEHFFAPIVSSCVLPEAKKTAWEARDALFNNEN